MRSTRNSILLLFTKATWLTRRDNFHKFDDQFLALLKNLGGILVNGKEFFDLKGRFPIAFTMWEYCGPKPL